MGKLPHVLCTSISKLSRGVGTRSLIEKQSALVDSGASAGLPASRLLSLSTPSAVLDLECCGEAERDEWWLTFDWLLWTWNQRRLNAAAAIAPVHSAQPPASRRSQAAEGRKGTWLGGVVGLFEQQERLLRHARQRRRNGGTTVNPTAQQPASGPPLSMQPAALPAMPRPQTQQQQLSYAASGAVLSERDVLELLRLLVSDIEAVREANRLLLVDDCAEMVDLQRRIDALRDDNALLIQQLRPDEAACC